MAVAGTVCISFSGLFFALSDVSGSTATFFRAVYAVPILLVLRLVWKGTDGRTVRQRWLSVAAGAFLGLDVIAWHTTIEMVGSGLGTVLVSVQVVFVGLISWALYRERPTRTTLVFGSMMFGGVVLISGLGSAATFGNNPGTGAALGVLAAFFYAAFLLTLRMSNPAGTAPPPFALLDATLGIVAVAFVFGTISGDLNLVPTWPGHGWLIALAIVGQVTGWTLISYALPRLPALTTSMILLIQPMLAMVWGWVVLSEQLSVIQGLGAVLVLGGMLAINRQASIVVRPVESTTPGRVDTTA